MFAMDPIHVRSRSRFGASMRTSMLLAACLWGSGAFAQDGGDGGQGEIGVLPVQGNIFMLVGDGGNVTVQVGDEGVLVVDTLQEEFSDRLLATIRELSDGPIRYVVSTHAHPDNVGGNATIAQAGSNIAGGNVLGAIEDAGETAKIIAHENVLITMSGAETPLPFEAWPTDTYFTDRKEVFFNGEAVQVLHQPAAHTNGDSIVFFRRSDVISTGDLFLTTRYPFIDRENGGTFQGIIDALNRIIDLTVPADRQEGGTMVIPGRGRLCDEADVVEYRDMLTIIRDRIRVMVEQGASLREVLDARPTLDYDGRYGADSGFWTTQQFITAIYEDMS